MMITEAMEDVEEAESVGGELLKDVSLLTIKEWRHRPRKTSNNNGCVEQDRERV